MFGCFNHWVVTLVAEELRQWLWEVYFGIRGLLHKQPEPKSNLTTDNPQNTCVGVTSINFRIWCFCDNYLKDVQCLLYLEDHGCRMVCEASSMVSYAISKIHNTQPLSSQLVCNQGNHSVVKTTNLFLQCRGWSFYTLVLGVAREGFNYYKTCYLGNITVG